MSIVNLPAFYDMIYVNKDDGKLSTDGYMYNDQMFQVLNDIVILLNAITSTQITGTSSNSQTVTINGINPPLKTTAEINAFVAETDTSKQLPVGTIWYNSDTDQLQFLSLVAGVRTLKTITSTP